MSSTKRTSRKRAADEFKAAKGDREIAAGDFLRPHHASAPVSVLQLNKNQFSRLLYTNPVCLLTSVVASSAAASSPSDAKRGSSSASDSSAASADPDSGDKRKQSPSRNVMTITWLTATSNHGELVCSMNASRYSAELVVPMKRFGAAVCPVCSQYILSQC